VEVALHGARRDVGQGGDLFVGEPPGLQPEDLHLALDVGVRVVVAVVANLAEDVLGEREATHGGLPVRQRVEPTHAVAIQASSVYSARFSRAEYNWSAHVLSGRQA